MGMTQNFYAVEKEDVINDFDFRDNHGENMVGMNLQISQKIMKSIIGCIPCGKKKLQNHLLTELIL